MAILKLPASRPRSGYTKSANATGGSRTDGVATRLGATSRQRSGVFGFAPQEEVTAVREESLVDQTRKQHEQNVSSPSFRRTNISGRRSCSLALVAGLAGISMAPSRSYGADALSLETEAEAGEGTGFLRNSGARGLLAEEEERLIKLRLTSEANAKRLDAEVKKELEQVIERARAEGEAEAKKSFERGSSLCATPYGIDIVGITEGIALIGALVGGIAAKSRKDEVQKLNEQLRTINVSLRKQARSGIVYAPDMNYAPPSGLVDLDRSKADSGDSSAEMTRADKSQEQEDNATATTTASASPASITTEVTSGERAREEATKKVKAPSQIPESPDTASALKKGRKLLESKKGAAALVHFEKARMLSRSDGNKVQERRAERGLAAASRMQKQFRKAIGHLERVLEISREIDEYTGDSDAYGNIADIYTELGDLEKAAKYYDLYIERMNE